jgi:hypothetical protein
MGPLLVARRTHALGDLLAALLAREGGREPLGEEEDRRVWLAARGWIPHRVRELVELRHLFLKPERAAAWGLELAEFAEHQLAVFAAHGAMEADVGSFLGSVLAREDTSHGLLALAGELAWRTRDPRTLRLLEAIHRRLLATRVGDHRVAWLGEVEMFMIGWLLGQDRLGVEAARGFVAGARQAAARLAWPSGTPGAVRRQLAGALVRATLDPQRRRGLAPDPGELTELDAYLAALEEGLSGMDPRPALLEARELLRTWREAASPAPPEIDLRMRGLATRLGP